MSLIVLLLLSLAAPPDFAAESAESSLNLRVDIDGEHVQVELDILLDATPQQVWEVVTDFSHMPDFLSNMKSSRVLQRHGNVLRVLQSGHTSVGPITFDFESEREMVLTPVQRIDTRLIRGNFKQFNAVTRLEAEGGKTRLRFRSDAESGRWIPPLVGRNFIESEIREHYREIQAELRRRQGLKAP